MRRRRFLARGWLALAGAIALGGCTEHTLEAAETEPPFVDGVDGLDLPVEQRLDVVEEGILDARSADLSEPTAFEAYLEERDVLVETLAAEEAVVDDTLEIEREDVDVVRDRTHGERPVLTLEYRQPDLAATGILGSIGLVAGGYGALVAAGYGADLLEATILDSAGSPFGSFHVLTAWAVEYDEGHTSAREYGAKALDTVASE